MLVRYFIGVDAGTSNVKAVLFDEVFNEIFVEKVVNEPIFIGNAEVEQNMDLLWEKVKECIKNIVKKANSEGIESKDILSIGVTGQGEGCWLIDEFGKPVQNAILWCDGRASDQVNYVTKEKPEIGELIYNTTGTQALTGTQLMILKWMHENKKEVLDSAKTVFFCKDFIRYHLTGKIETDFSDCSTSMLDIRTGEVASEVLKELGLEDYISYIPKPVKSDSNVGNILKDIAKELGLSSETKVVAGAIDVSACALGAGAIKENDSCIILGTTCASEVMLKKDSCKFGLAGTRYERLAIDNLYMLLQPTMNGTPNLDWMLSNIALNKDFDEINSMIAKVDVGCGGVIYHPYISEAGERSPFYHRYARASFWGISSVTKREHLIRSVYEGITFSIKDCLAGMDLENVYIIGGGIKSEAWVQMICDALGVNVFIPNGSEFGAKGVAIMSAVACKVYDSYEEVFLKSDNIKKSYKANLENTEKYNSYYELYKKIRIANESLWDLRHKINKKFK